MAIETKNKILISMYIEKDLYKKIKKLARVDGSSSASKINELLKGAIKICEKPAKASNEE